MELGGYFRTIFALFVTEFPSCFVEIKSFCFIRSTKNGFFFLHSSINNNVIIMFRDVQVIRFSHSHVYRAKVTIIQRK